MLFSRHIYWTTLGHILFILATAGTGLWLIISQQGVVIGILLVICSLFQIGRLVNKLNSFNQKLRLFFDAIEDKDNMLYFPEINVSREQEMLNRSLNRINALLIRTQAEYSKQEHFYRSLLEEVPSGVLAWDSSGKIMMANSAALTLLGCQQLAQYDQLKPILQEKEKKERLSLSQNQMKLQNETITILSIKDISNELNDKESESWNKLSHVLTHEIMNTIAPIISLSQTLSAYPDNSEKTLRGLHIIQAQSERLLEFTESFRRLSYLPQPERKRFSLTALLQNLQELLSTDFQENQIHFTLTCQPEFIDMDGDENQLSQVLLNLLRNSIQALDGRTDGAIEIYAYRDEHISIDVTDNGPGIPDELQEKIFIPFFTTKSEGTGIGLSLCRQIIRNHHEFHIRTFLSHNLHGIQPILSPEEQLRITGIFTTSNIDNAQVISGILIVIILRFYLKPLFDFLFILSKIYFILHITIDKYRLVKIQKLFIYSGYIASMFYIMYGITKIYPVFLLLINL